MGHDTIHVKYTVLYSVLYNNSINLYKLCKGCSLRKSKIEEYKKYYYIGYEMSLNLSVVFSLSVVTFMIRLVQVKLTSDLVKWIIPRNINNKKDKKEFSKVKGRHYEKI